ncbi:MAG TPA: peptidylprolyl isomerase [Candidatus Eisenbacteria bacterium]
MSRLPRSNATRTTRLAAATLATALLAALTLSARLEATEPTGSTDAPAKAATTTTPAPTAKATQGKSGKTNPGKTAMKGTMPVKPATTPEHVQVQHILIGFAKDPNKQSTVPGKPITRTMAEAKALAYKILDQARAGTPFDTLVVQYTEDSPPGIYSMSGIGVTKNPGEWARNEMVAAFGDVGFNISVGNIDIAEYDPAKSPFGYHIIKRLK